MSYHWLPDEKYQKALFHARSQFAAVLNCFRCYDGLQLVDGAIDMCVEICEQFGQVVRGKDRPIKVIDNPTRRPTE